MAAMKKTTQLKPLGSSSDKAAIARAKAKKVSTSYSPKPMSANDKKAAGFRGATTQWQIMLKKKDAAAAAAKAKKK